MITVEINDADLTDLLRKLDRLNVRELLPVIEKYGKEVQEIAEVYPAPVAGYVRTGHLARSWYHRLYGLDMIIGNQAVYAGWVHGMLQVSYHKARGWKQLLRTAEAGLPELIRKLEAKIRAIWEA